MVLGFARLKAWFAPPTRTTESQNVTKALSEDSKARLQQATNVLPLPQAYGESLTEAIASPIARWVEDEDAPNTLAVLGAPIEPLELILPSLVASPAFVSCPKILQFPSAPTTEPAVRVEQFIAELGRERQLVIIPSLSRCFLRCIGGLDGIEALQNAAFHDRAHFWLVGCNIWAWQYLSKTHQLQADFEQTLQLPLLLGEDLQRWLTPAAAEVALDLEVEGIKARFKELAELSLGLSCAARTLWIEALGEGDAGVVFERPKRPKLPELEMGDRYLLYSLVLHEKLGFSQLAASLGEEENSVRATLQRLQQLGAIEFRQGLFSLHPSHYPKLLADLGQNNFLVDN
ncbi:MAG: hypothetical protein SW833_12720 [Cyanobacteriota bacterium]|nr:hypothetical protein [Cyanobacteriota bacterium]